MKFFHSSFDLWCTIVCLLIFLLCCYYSISHYVFIRVFIGYRHTVLFTLANIALKSIGVDDLFDCRSLVEQRVYNGSSFFFFLWIFDNLQRYAHRIYNSSKGFSLFYDWPTWLTFFGNVRQHVKVTDLG